jgi:hypothetical protein
LLTLHGNDYSYQFISFDNLFLFISPSLWLDWSHASFNVLFYLAYFHTIFLIMTKITEN